MYRNKTKNNVFLLALTAASFITTRAEAGLTINLDFSSFSTDAPSDGSDILGGANLADAQAVIQQAANYWESIFANSTSSIAWSTNIGGNLTQNITVAWGAKDGATLASGGASWFLSDGRWGSGSLTWDNDGSSEFYVDTDPGYSDEWSQSSSRDMDFNGVSMNAERVHYDAAAGTARDNADMMSVAIHEIGHALGFLSKFPAYLASDLDSDGDIDITGLTFTGAQIGISGGHTGFQMDPPGLDFPYDPGGGVWDPIDYYPSAMGPSTISGTRKLLTEADIAIAAEFLEFDMSTVNFNPSLVPEPSSMGLLGAACLLWPFHRRRRINREC